MTSCVSLTWHGCYDHNNISSRHDSLVKWPTQAVNVARWWLHLCRREIYRTVVRDQKWKQKTFVMTNKFTIRNKWHSAMRVPRVLHGEISSFHYSSYRLQFWHKYSSQQYQPSELTLMLFSVPRDGNQDLENAIFRPWRTENKELRSLFSVPGNGHLA